MSWVDIVRIQSDRWQGRRDDPEHKAVRSVFNDAFRPKKIEALKNEIKAKADQIIRHHQDRENLARTNASGQMYLGGRHGRAHAESQQTKNWKLLKDGDFWEAFEENIPFKNLFKVEDGSGSSSI